MLHSVGLRMYVIRLPLYFRGCSLTLTLAASLDVLQRVRHLLQLLLRLANLAGERLVEVALLGNLLVVLRDRILAGRCNGCGALVQAPFQVRIVALGLVPVKKKNKKTVISRSNALATPESIAWMQAFFAQPPSSLPL